MDNSNWWNTWWQVSELIQTNPIRQWNTWWQFSELIQTEPLEWIPAIGEIEEVAEAVKQHEEPEDEDEDSCDDSVMDEWRYGDAADDLLRAIPRVRALETILGATIRTKP